MRKVYLRIAAGAVLASVVGWAAVAIVVPVIVGRFEEDGFRAPLISGGLRFVAASIEAAPRQEWPARLDAARRELTVPLAIVPIDALPSSMAARLRSRAPAIVSGTPGPPSIYIPLTSGADVLVAGPLPALPLEPLITTAVIVALVLTITTSAAVGIPLVRRLRRLRNAIAELGGGNLGVRLDPNEGELSELAESINRMAAQLQRQFQERDALLQAVSHEMGTPLSRMRFAIELLEDRSGDEERTRRLRALAADLDELDRLSSELVAWMEPDGVRPSKRVFLVAPVLDSLVELEYETVGAPVHMELRVHPDVKVYADQRQFQRAIENLLRNARRYAQHLIVLQAETEGQRVLLQVRDDGPGIARDQWARVLDPFVRLDAAPSGAHRGLGLGLAIVRRIVEAHGGSVRVADAPEGGTQVTTSWPRAAGEDRGPHRSESG